MIYLDTSFIAPYYLVEATSVRIEAIFMAADSGNFAISLWTRVEFASLLARKVRMNELNQTDVIAAMRTFENDVEAYTTWGVGHEKSRCKHLVNLQG